MKTITVTEQQIRVALRGSGRSPLADDLIERLFGSKPHPLEERVNALEHHVAELLEEQLDNKKPKRKARK